MAKRLSNIDRQRMELAAIVKRLPLHQQLGASQTALLELTPIWQRAVTQHIGDTSLNAEFHGRVSLHSFDNGVLTVACHHSGYASQLKHLHTSLLNTIQAHCPALRRINIQLKQPNTQAESPNHLNAQAQSTVNRKISPINIKAITYCQQSVGNEKLARSLSKLVNTLKQSSE